MEKQNKQNDLLVNQAKKERDSTSLSPKFSTHLTTNQTEFNQSISQHNDFKNYQKEIDVISEAESK